MIAQCTHKLSATKFHKIHCQTYIVYIIASYTQSHMCADKQDSEKYWGARVKIQRQLFMLQNYLRPTTELIMVPAKTEVVVLVLVFSVLVSRPEVRLYQR